ncbi:MAG: XdhC family protein, partial [Sphingomonadales bacterium]
MVTTSDHDAMRYAAGNPAALCTIVGIEGSFSRRCGAQLAVGADETIVGDMADNCLDAELRSQAAAAMRTGKVKLLRYGAGSPFIDFRLPCGSGLDILVDPAPARALLARCVDDLQARRETVLALPV